MSPQPWWPDELGNTWDYHSLKIAETRTGWKLEKAPPRLHRITTGLPWPLLLPRSHEFMRFSFCDPLWDLADMSARLLGLLSYIILASSNLKFSTYPSSFYFWIYMSSQVLTWQKFSAGYFQSPFLWGKIHKIPNGDSEWFCHLFSGGPFNSL